MGHTRGTPPHLGLHVARGGGGGTQSPARTLEAKRGHRCQRMKVGTANGTTKASREIEHPKSHKKECTRLHV